MSLDKNPACYCDFPGATVTPIRHTLSAYTQHCGYILDISVFFLFSFSRTPFFILYKWFSRESSHLSETQHVSVMVGDSGGCQNSFDCSSISRMNSIPLEDSRWIDFFMMLVESAVNVLSPKSPALCFFRGHNMWERVTAKIERLLINISVTQEII